MEQLNLARIGFDGVQMLIPQGGIATIEMIDSVELSDVAPGAIGSLSSGGRDWPVFALDADFGILNEPTDAHKYCVAFDIDSQAAFALACDEVGSLALASIDEIKPVQACMRSPGSPVDAMVLQDGVLMLVSRVDTLNRFLVRST